MKTKTTEGFRDMRHRSSVERGDAEIRGLNDMAAITNPETQPLAESNISTSAETKISNGRFNVLCQPVSGVVRNTITGCP